MPVHDWTRVQAGIFHDFHHAWIEELKRALNSGLLPEDYYALAEQHAGGSGPDVLSLEAADRRDGDSAPWQLSRGGGNLLLDPPQVQLTAESELDFYRRRQSQLVVRHATEDRVVAVLEIVSPGNKASRAAMRAFVEKAARLLEQRVHLLVLDLHPPSPRDPDGVHGAIWEEVTG